MYTPEMFVFVDETGADRRNTPRKYGYSMRGRPALNHSFLIRGERISATACISLHGLLNVKTFERTSNNDTFNDFVQENLLPHVMPFDGKNHHSVVVLDNCAYTACQCSKGLVYLSTFFYHTHPTSIPSKKPFPMTLRASWIPIVQLMYKHHYLLVLQVLVHRTVKVGLHIQEYIT